MCAETPACSSPTTRASPGSALAVASSEPPRALIDDVHSLALPGTGRELAAVPHVQVVQAVDDGGSRPGPDDHAAGVGGEAGRISLLAQRHADRRTAGR